MRRQIAWLLPWALVACVTDGAKYRIRPDGPLLAGREAWVSATRSAPARRVNVVLLVADDLGYADVGAMGRPGPRIATPNLDALAAQGVTFEQGYVTSPLCSPSRAGLLTGRYQQRFGHEGQPHDRYAKNALEFFVFEHFVAGGEWQLERRVAPDAEDVRRQGLPVGELTLADLLKRHGYATGVVGKWHLGAGHDFQPRQRGFDEHYGVYEAYTLYADPPDRGDVVNVKHGDFSERFIWGKGRSGTAAVRRDDVVVEEPGYLTTRFADEAVAFIDKHRAEPFFLYVPFTAPHTPFQALKTDVAKFEGEPDENRRVYLALVASLDEAVGRVVKAIDERGLGGETLVVFMSDNGGALYTGATTNAPFKGGKFTLFEGGIRVPMMARLPGRLPAGLRYAQPV
ncbi:MAG: sulfatase-like hydrolase/transferase, partial [Myxococcaceae bacterium]|nr:sulfatase-like hydrolase/transferase [Myxococcaceae bacterium]